MVRETSVPWPGRACCRWAARGTSPRWRDITCCRKAARGTWPHWPGTLPCLMANDIWARWREAVATRPANTTGASAASPPWREAATGRVS